MILNGKHQSLFSQQSFHESLLVKVINKKKIAANCNEMNDQILWENKR